MGLLHRVRGGRVCGEAYLIFKSVSGNFQIIQNALGLLGRFLQTSQFARWRPCSSRQGWQGRCPRREVGHLAPLLLAEP